MAHWWVPPYSIRNDIVDVAFVDISELGDYIGLAFGGNAPSYWDRALGLISMPSFVIKT